MDKIAITLCCILLTSCATVPKQAGQYCDIAAPYFFNDDAERIATPDQVKRFIVTNNVTGAELCDWQPKEG